ncbi:MAG: helix-turn-helix transcriptional regulator [Gammaproteobacteria bacterium]
MLIRTTRNLGLLVRTARVARGWSQAVLAREAGTTQKQVSFVENGRLGTSIDLVLRLFSVLKVTLVAELATSARSPAHWIDEVADRGRKR